MIGVFFNGVLHPLRPDGQYRECGLLGYFENKKENRPALLEARQHAYGVFCEGLLETVACQHFPSFIEGN